VVARGPQGQALRLVSIMADVTERRLAEEQLRVERERLGLALSAGRMGAYEFNIGQGALWWSPEMYALFGVRADQFVPTPESVVALIHPVDREVFAASRAQALSQHRTLVVEFRVQRPDGTLAWLAHRGQAEYDAEDVPIRTFGVVMDITARKQIEDLIRDADRKKDAFIATLAHELRNPLAPIRNAIGVLRQLESVDPTATWCRDVIDRQVTQMARLLDDLLDVARLQGGQLRLQLEAMDLRSAIDLAVEIAQPVIDAAGHSFAVALPAQPLDLDGDLLRLGQVFSNILINAAKYTPPNGRIALDVEKVDDRATVTVTDSGVGIAAHDMALIFEIFGQVDSAVHRSQGGQGIGLSLAKGLVEMHGGTISANSAGPGKGSQFVVQLPLLRQRAQRGPDEVGPAAAAQHAEALRILVADDLRDGSDSLARLLRALGHVVEVAYDGNQAIRLAEASQPDVVLLDLGMPELDGYDVCRRIRAAPWGTRTMLIAQSGWGREQDRQRTHEAGFDHHLLKPVEPSTLMTLLRRRH
jgi:PAS domain S-box-containing protein